MEVGRDRHSIARYRELTRGAAVASFEPEAACAPSRARVSSLRERAGARGGAPVGDGAGHGTEPHDGSEPKRASPVCYDHHVRPSPVALFVVATIALVGGMGFTAMRESHGAERAGVPSDAAGFGFVVRSHAGDVALLVATRPFKLALANGPVHGEPPKAFEAAAAVVGRELDRYPSAFLRQIRLGGVVFTHELAENEMPIPSLPNVGGLLLLDASSVQTDLVRALHHEIYHFFDLVDDGRLSPDPGWDALNPASFAYGSGGRTIRGAWAARPANDLPGFVSAYATSGAEEDKAETFAFVVVRSSLVERRISNDPVLHAKVAELGRRLTKFEAECPRRLGFDAMISAL
jgi:hypothetical protein